MRDRAAARAAVDRILSWDVDRVIMAHGDVLDAGGYDALRDSFAWLPPANAFATPRARR